MKHSVSCKAVEAAHVGCIYYGTCLAMQSKSQTCTCSVHTPPLKWKNRCCRHPSAFPGICGCGRKLSWTCNSHLGLTTCSQSGFCFVGGLVMYGVTSAALGNLLTWKKQVKTNFFQFAQRHHPQLQLW